MVSIGMRNICVMLAFMLVPIGGAMAQLCEPCQTHCDLVGATANAACVKSGVDPVVCGNPRIANAANSKGVTTFEAQRVMVDAGQRCTTQGICYRAGAAATASCMAACFICAPSSVHPDFLLISILYAPPGNASTASFGQSKSSGAIYGISNNVSNSQSTSVAVSGGFMTTSDDSSGDDSGSSPKGGYSVNVQNGVSSGSSNGSGTSQQFSAVTTATGTANLKPGKDPIDHTQDIFLLWLNPAVTLSRSDQTTLTAAITSGQAQMSVQTVSAGQLMNGIPPEKLAPTKICPTPNDPTSCYTSPGLGSLTKDDISNILGQDPFLTAPNATPDPSRFLYVQSNALENTTVAANVTQTFTVSDARTTTQTTARVSGSSEGVSTNISAKVLTFGISLTNSDTWTWAHTVTRGVSNGQTQQASVTLSTTTQTCCGIGGPSCQVAIYEDMIYRTFVFLPQPETCQSSLLGTTPGTAATPLALPVGSFTGVSLWGAVTRGNSPAKAEMVTVSNGTGKVLYRIVTDHAGRYFSGGIAPGPVTVRVGTQTLHATVRSGQSAVLNVKL
jgi:hypothetical protein